MIKYHCDLVQGTDVWFAARLGILTASKMKNILTPKKLEYAENDKQKSYLYEILAQRITNYMEPEYLSNDMLRGQTDESYAREIYHENYSPVKECGFITNDKWGFTLGCSPDGLVGDDGLIECKSRSQKYQLETILAGLMPDDYRLQVQTALLVSERPWCDFISYSGGMPMLTVKVFADLVVQEAIIAAASKFHHDLDELHWQYKAKMTDKSNRLIATERRETEMYL